jgi:replication-associated recombination protein RarA
MYHGLRNSKYICSFSDQFIFLSRPTKIEEVSHQVEVVRGLTESVKNGHIPHLLMYGPPGTGKTSTVLAMAKELFG